MAQCLHFFLSQPSFFWLHRRTGPQVFRPRELRACTRKYCFTGISPAQGRRKAVFPGPQWRDSPTPHAKHYPCVLQLGCCPAFPVASTNVTLYPQPPTRLSGRQPPSKKLTSFYQVSRTACLAISPSLAGILRCGKVRPTQNPGLGVHLR